MSQASVTEGFNLIPIFNHLPSFCFNCIYNKAFGLLAQLWHVSIECLNFLRPLNCVLLTYCNVWFKFLLRPSLGISTPLHNLFQLKFHSPTKVQHINTNIQIAIRDFKEVSWRHLCLDLGPVEIKTWVKNGGSCSGGVACITVFRLVFKVAGLNGRLCGVFPQREAILLRYLYLAGKLTSKPFSKALGLFKSWI